jgi:hypothetical protein
MSAMFFMTVPVDLYGAQEEYYYSELDSRPFGVTPTCGHKKSSFAGAFFNFLTEISFGQQN